MYFSAGLNPSTVPMPGCPVIEFETVAAGPLLVLLSVLACPNANDASATQATVINIPFMCNLPFLRCFRFLNLSSRPSGTDGIIVNLRFQSGSVIPPMISSNSIDPVACADCYVPHYSQIRRFG